ncbi:unknown [Crocosphaera subtropica ATCC 51142]|uniref:Putative restriction endonuclease domain-containing protein n=1 Tax=Crocosphaera subtropica (strain ATCC 51142 / BH68) TaxID=43989 RepID=B1WWN0_CROS5|nr:Uma2 family endonuclease [Crocosphaera subtropica]ACB50754.1 unknown [Crocosphaera subtropica ATCC 51142]
MQTIQTPQQLRLWTVKEYHYLTKIGVLHPTEKLELLEGQIVRMAAKGTSHTVATRRTAKLLENLLNNQAAIYTQDPITLNDYSEPEPDIIVVIPDSLDYFEHHPKPSDIHLIIEVADSSLEYDLTIKSEAYAKSNIKEYWVLDVNERQLHIFRQPTSEGYKNCFILTEEEEINLSHFSQIRLSIQAMLPPKI